MSKYCVKMIIQTLRRPLTWTLCHLMEHQDLCVSSVGSGCAWLPSVSLPTSQDLSFFAETPADGSVHRPERLESIRKRKKKKWAKGLRYVWVSFRKPAARVTFHRLIRTLTSTRTLWPILLSPERTPEALKLRENCLITMLCSV